MPSFYRMTDKNPCPACGRNHFFQSVPFYEESKGATFEVTCPETNKIVLVTVHPDETPPSRTTEVKCGLCNKAFYQIREQSKPEGNLVTQQLECENPGCGHTTVRRINIQTGQIIQQS